MKIDLFTSQSSCRCTKCNERLTVKGHWYNQLGISFYLDFWFMIHSILKHNENLTLKDWKYVLKMTGKLILILLLEILFNIWWIIGIPFRFLFG